MRNRTRYIEAEKRLINTEEAAAYIGMGISKTREIMETIGAKRRIGRRVVYDKVVIDQWLDSMAHQEIKKGND